MPRHFQKMFIGPFYIVKFLLVEINLLELELKFKNVTYNYVVLIFSLSAQNLSTYLLRITTLMLLIYSLTVKYTYSLTYMYCDWSLNTTSRICKEKDFFWSFFQHAVISVTLNAFLYSFCTNNVIMLISYLVTESAFHLVLQFVSYL